MDYQLSFFRNVLGIAIALTALTAGVIAWGIAPALTDPTAVMDFFFERTLLQWAIILVFWFALTAAVHRIVALTKLTRGIRALGSRKDRESLPPVLSDRVRRLRACAERGGPAAALNLEREMASKAEDAMLRVYGLLGGAVQLSLGLGFAGTLWGISRKLFGTFGNLAEVSTDQLKSAMGAFTAALGTSLDSTVLAVISSLLVGVVVGVAHWIESGAMREIHNRLTAMIAPGRADVSPEAQATWLVQRRLPEVAGELISETRRSLEEVVTRACDGFSAGIAEIISNSALEMEGYGERLRSEIATELQERSEAVVDRVLDEHLVRAERSLDERLSTFAASINELPRIVIQSSDGSAVAALPSALAVGERG